VGRSNRSKTAVEIRLMFPYDQCARNAFRPQFYSVFCPSLAATNAPIIAGIAF
jgi:hypothetical protein